MRRSSKWLIAIIVCAIAIYVANSFWQHSESHEELAKEFAYLAHDPSYLDMKASIKQGFKMQMQMYQQSGNECMKGLSPKIEKLIDETISDIPVSEEYARLYQQQFTAEELKELIRFFESDVGQKARTVMPQIAMRASQTNTQTTAALQSKLQPLVLKHIQSECIGGKP